MWNKCFLHETTRLCFFFFFLSPTGSARLLFVCQDFLLPLLYYTVFLSFLLPKSSCSATEDTQDLLTSLWPLVGIEGSRHFGLGLAISGVTLRHVVLFFFFPAGDSRTHVLPRSLEQIPEQIQRRPVYLPDFQMSQLNTSRHDGPALAPPPSHPPGNFSRSGRCPPHLPPGGRRNYHN